MHQASYAADVLSTRPTSLKRLRWFSRTFEGNGWWPCQSSRETERRGRRPGCNALTCSGPTASGSSCLRKHSKSSTILSYSVTLRQMGEPRSLNAIQVPLSSVSSVPFSIVTVQPVHLVSYRRRVLVRSFVRFTSPCCVSFQQDFSKTP